MKIVLGDILSGTVLTKINNSFQKIQDAINNKVLFRDNPQGEPNAMLQDLDMNGNRILNLPKPVRLSEPVRLLDVTNFGLGNGVVPVAIDIPFTPVGSIGSVNVQAAIAEMLSETKTTTDGLATSLSNTNTQLDLLYYGVTNVRKYGAKGDGTTDDTVAIQAAATAAGYGGTLYFAAGTYLVSSTITLRGATKLVGLGIEQTIIYRTGNYGDTFVCGTAADQSEPARSFGAYKIRFQHSVPYAANSTTLPNKVTAGAHLRIRGAQEAKIEDCWFFRMRFGVYCEGGSWVKVINSQFLGVYDPSNTALQESIAGLVAAYSTVHGNPTTWLVTGNNFLGATFERVVAYSTNAGVSNVNRIATIGQQYGFLVDGCEDLVVSNNYFGGQNVSELAFVQSAGGSIIDVRINNNFFDGIAEGSGILVAPTVAGKLALGVTIEGNIFTDNLHSIFINQNTGDNLPSVLNATIRGNTCLSGIGSQMLIVGLKGFIITDNTISDYNKYAFTSTDASYISAINIYGASSSGQVVGNTIGGGGNSLINSTGANQCYQGIINSTITVHVSKNYYNGLREGSNFRTGVSNEENQTTLTSGNYQVTQSDSIVLINKATNEVTVLALPLYPVVGREVVVKDIKGNAASFTTTVQCNDGAVIDGSTTNVISSNYGFRRFRFNGSSWNVI